MGQVDALDGNSRSIGIIERGPQCTQDLADRCRMLAKGERAHVLAVVQQPSAFRGRDRAFDRSEEHTSELQSLMRNSYAVFCLKIKYLLNSIQHSNTPTNITNTYLNSIPF